MKIATETFHVGSKMLAQGFSAPEPLFLGSHGLCADGESASPTLKRLLPELEDKTGGYQEPGTFSMYNTLLSGRLKSAKATGKEMNLHVELMLDLAMSHSQEVGEVFQKNRTTQRLPL